MLKIELDKEFILKFLKFGLVGFSGIFVDFGITVLFKEKLKVHKYVANSLGFIAATSSNYLLNRYWTFADGKDAELAQFGQFFAIALVGLIFNNVIIYLLNDKFKLNFYVAKAIAILLVSLWNFFVNYLYTFTA